MRIALISPLPPLRGGIAAHGECLRGALSRWGDVSAFGFRRLYPGRLHPGAGVRTTADAPGVEAMLDCLDPRTWLRLRRRLEQAAFDRVVVEWWHPWFSRLVGVTCGDLRTPVTLMCHNVEPHERYPGWRRASLRAFSVADSLVCHSRFVASQAERLAPDLPRRVCPMPVLLAPLDASDRERARRRLGVRAGARLALFAGHVRPYKGLDVLLAAWQRAALSPLSALVIAGPSYIGHARLESKVRRLVRRRGVRLIDRYLPDDELRAWMAAADVLVLPYTRASQSGLAVAGAAAGMTIVASDVGGLGEQARDLGAVLVEPGNVDSLAAVLSRLLGGAHDAVRQSAPTADSARRPVDRLAGAADVLARACLASGECDE